MEKLIVLAALAACAHAAQTCPAGDPAAFDRCGKQLLATTPISPEIADRAIAGYVAEVGAHVASATGDRGRWRFAVIEESKLEAHAAPGIVYVSRGMLIALRDEAELAAVLAHQLAHALAGHADQIRAEGESSRDDELQADALAVAFVARAGYDPRAVLSATRAIAAEDADNPSWDARVDRIALLAHARPTGERAGDRYRTRLAGLAVGVDSRVVSIVGDAIVFGGPRVALDPPPGFSDVGISYVGIADAAALVRDHATVMIFPVAPAFAPYLPRWHKPDEQIEIYTRGGHALAVDARGPEAAKALADVMARFRAARADELARLTPTRVDFAAPRALR
jgi:hypothetical protein